MNRTSERIIVPLHVPTPLPSHLRTELTSALLSESAIPVVQSALSDAFRDAGWMDLVRDRAKQLISSGQATTWHEVMERLMMEARGNQHSRQTPPGGLRRKHENEGVLARGNSPADHTVSVRFPEDAANKGKEAVRNALENLVEIENANTAS